MRHYIGSMRNVLTIPSALTRAVLLCLLLMAASAAVNAGGEPYGMRYISAGEELLAGNVDVPLTPSPERLAELRDEAALLAEQIQLLEYEQGPYGPGLSESLGDLARIFEEAGDVDGAMGARERALHLLRVNEGLNSPSQGPLVRELLNSLRRRGEFEALDDRYDYFFRLYGAGRPPWSEARWNAFLEYLSWQRQALVLELDGDPKGRLYDLYERHEDLLNAYRDEELVLSWQQFRDLAASQLATFYLIDTYIEPRDQMSQSQQWDYRRTDDPADFDLYRERLENIQRGLRSRARKLLEESLEKIPTGETEARAQVELALADWLQWQGSTRQATDRYESLWLSLNEDGRQDLATEWFSQPTPLPAAEVFLVNDRLLSPPVTLGVQVSESGRSKVSPANVPATLERTAARLRRLLFATRFRPQLIDGTAVASSMTDGNWILLDP